MGHYFFKTDTWKSGTEYKTGDQVICYGEQWECIIDHVANCFGDEIFGKKTDKGIVPICWKKKVIQ